MARNLLISVQVYKPFTYINIFTFCLFFPGGYFFIWYLNWGLVGFGVLKFVIEVINAIGLAIVLPRNLDKQFYNKENMTPIWDVKEICFYIKQFTKVVFGWYAYYAGSEFITFFIGIMHDTNLMAAWAAVFNLQTIVWVIGGGISNTIRSDVGINIGQRKSYVAKKYAIVG